MEVPDIKPRAMPEFKSKQSKYIHAGKLPMRAVVLGPSGSGKTVLLQNMILDIYEGCSEQTKGYLVHLYLLMMPGRHFQNTLKRNAIN